MKGSITRRLVAAGVALIAAIGCGPTHRPGEPGESPGQHRADEAPLERAALVLDTTRTLPFPELLHGFNLGNTAGMYDYLDSVIIAATSELRPRLLRFPGGTVSNLYHWRSSGFRAAELRARGRSLNAFKGLQRRRGGRMSFDDFMELCRRFEIDPLIVVNLVTGSPEESAGWVAHAKEKGYRIAGWELGNELYLATYRDRFPSVESYMAAAERHADAMRAVDPEIVLAVPAAPEGFGERQPSQRLERQRRWNEVLGQASFYDAYSAHFYTRPRVRSVEQIEQARRTLFSSSDLDLPRAIQYYDSLFGGKPMWITEWNLENPENPVMNTRLHAMFAGDFFLSLVSAGPPVTKAAFHTLAGLNRAWPVLSPRSSGERTRDRHVKRATYSTFQIIGRSIRPGVERVELQVRDAPTLQVQGRSPLPGLKALALKGSGGIVILISNRTDRDLPLEIVLGQTPYDRAVTYSFIGGPSLTASNGGNTQITEAAVAEVGVQEWSGPASALIVRRNSFGALDLR